MASYSGTPLARKLGIRPGTRVVLVGAPRGFRAELEPLPEGVRASAAARGTFDVALAFVPDASALRARLGPLKTRLATDGGLWIAWPKKSSGVPTDLAFDTVQRAGLAAGLVDNKVCAVDDTWSALRFVYRRADRPTSRGKVATREPRAKRAPGAAVRRRS